MSEESDAINNLASAIRELAAVMRGPQPKPKPAFHCQNCGSPNWKPGGMGEEFKQCSDCGTLGDPINEAGNP
jgi:hypothetical protein